MNSMSRFNVIYLLNTSKYRNSTTTLFLYQFSNNKRSLVIAEVEKWLCGEMFPDDSENLFLYGFERTVGVNDRVRDIFEELRVSFSRPHMERERAFLEMVQRLFFRVIPFNAPYPRFRINVQEDIEVGNALS